MEMGSAASRNDFACLVNNTSGNPNNQPPIMVLNVDEPFYVSPRNLSFGARDALHWERTALPPSAAERLHRPAPPPGKTLDIPDVCCHYALDGAEAARRRAAAESAYIPAPPPMTSSRRDPRESHRKRCPPPRQDTDVVRVGEVMESPRKGVRTLEAMRALLNAPGYLQDAHTEQDEVKRFARRPCNGLWHWQSRDFNLNHEEGERRTAQQIAADQKREKERETQQVFRDHLENVAMYRAANRIHLRTKAHQHPPQGQPQPITAPPAAAGGTSPAARPLPISRGSSAAVDGRATATSYVVNLTAKEKGTIGLTASRHESTNNPNSPRHPPGIRAIAEAVARTHLTNAASRPATSRGANGVGAPAAAAPHGSPRDDNEESRRPLSSRIRRKIEEMASKFLLEGGRA
jgi:hypothetical protein